SVISVVSPPVVALAGGGLVAAAPQRPVQVVVGRVGRAAERGVHAADLVDAQAGQRHAVASGDQPVTADRGRAGRLSTAWWPPLWPGCCGRARRRVAARAAWRR